MRISDWSSDVCSSDLVRIFRTIPGLQDAQFARLGGLHRNTFINSPRLLDDRLRLKAVPRISFAGQITGCEGYVESAAVGLMAGRFAAAEVLGRSIAPPTVPTAPGAPIGSASCRERRCTYVSTSVGAVPLTKKTQ